MCERKHTVTRTYQHRPLAFEQLESKAAPSSILLVVSAGNAQSGFADAAPAPVASEPLRASNYRYETEQVLRFIAENTTGCEYSHRPAALPTAADCEVSDEMMRQVATDSDSLFVLGFYEVESEL